MSELRRINVCLPGPMLQLVDAAVQREKRNRSAWIRAAVRLYLRVKRQQELAAAMRRGYQEMGEENLALAAIGPEEAADWAAYEAFLEGDTGEGA
ncbi:MAG: ribbon-helix-helix protein, CopG family [Bacillota bacterium]|nr:ribbon-helix-helix protein, CopG family [Bacillota bacterium]